MRLKWLSRGHGEGERGQSIVEFAVVLPVFLVLLFALVDFGRGFQSWIEVTNAAREGARAGATGADSGAIETRARAAAASLDQGSLSVSSSGAGGTPGGSVVVTTTYQLSLITPISPLLTLLSGDSIGSTITLTSTADMRIE